MLEKFTSALPPGVSMSIMLQTTAEPGRIRAIVNVRCTHKAAIDMTAKDLAPEILSGTIQEVENDLFGGPKYGRIVNKMRVAGEAEAKDAQAKATKAAAPPAAAPATAAAPKKAAPAATKAAAPVATAQTSITDPDQGGAPLASTPVTTAPVSNTPVAVTKLQEKFRDQLDELQYTINGKSKKLAEAKMEELKATGRDLKKVEAFVAADVARYNELKLLVPDLPEEETTAELTNSVSTPDEFN